MPLDEKLFDLSIQQAKLALAEKEVAVGCVFYHVDLEQVISRGRNSVNATQNATRHAEINCIDDAIDYCNINHINQQDLWPKIDVYVTCEPCIMCARILRHLKVRHVYYGCSNVRFGGCKSVIDVATSTFIRDEQALEYTNNIREQETIDLLRAFYSGENMNAPEEIRKCKKPKLSILTNSNDSNAP